MARLLRRLFLPLLVLLLLLVVAPLVRPPPQYDHHDHLRPDGYDDHQQDDEQQQQLVEVAPRVFRVLPSQSSQDDVQQPQPQPDLADVRRWMDGVLPASVRRLVDRAAARHLRRMHRSSTRVPEAPTSVTALLLDVYYAELRDAYPHVLTYQPAVDCTNGRYLVLEAQADGFGISTRAQMLKTLLQLETNLTGVHVPFTSTHHDAAAAAAAGSTDETDAEQDRFWGFGDWEVARADLEACPPGSAVLTNVHDLTPQPTLAEIVEAVHALAAAGTGGIVFAGEAGLVQLPRMGAAARHRYFLARQWLIEVRWNVRVAPAGRQALRGRRGTITGADIAEAALLPAQEPWMRLGIHVRRGDILSATAPDRPAPLMEDRYRPNAAYLAMALRLLALVDANVGRRAGGRLPAWARPTVTVYSEGTPAELADLTGGLAARGYTTYLNLDPAPSRAFAALAEADLTVLAPNSEFSCYSYIHQHRLRVGDAHVGVGPCWGFALASGVGPLAVDHDDLAGLDVLGATPAGRVRGDAARLWLFLLEWKLRRAEHLALHCHRGSGARNVTAATTAAATLRACLVANPYYFLPIGPVSPALAGPS